MRVVVDAPPGARVDLVLNGVVIATTTPTGGSTVLFSRPPSTNWLDVLEAMIDGFTGGRLFRH